MTEPVDSIGELRGKLVRRLAVAAILVVFLMATLAVFDYLSSPEEVESPVFTQPVPVPPKKEISQPVTPAENLPEPPAPPPAPEVKPAETPVPPPPVPEAAPAPAETPGPGPSALPRGAAPARPMAPASEPAKRVPPKPAPVMPEQTEAPMIMPPLEKAVRTPPREVLMPKAQRETLNVSPAGMARLFSGFLLQAGVFSSAQRAEELHARLTLSGIPSSLETRVQIGPFRTRQEAEAAQDKLKSLGVETVLLPPKGSPAKH